MTNLPVISAWVGVLTLVAVFMGLWVAFKFFMVDPDDVSDHDSDEGNSWINVNDLLVEAGFAEYKEY